MTKFEIGRLEKKQNKNNFIKITPRFPVYSETGTDNLTSEQLQATCERDTVNVSPD